jgi:2-iminobutanoate/2-iminopropanoate deaminase
MKIISTTKAPQAIGPYSQAIATNGFLFASGQIPLDPATMVVHAKTIAEQTAQVLENIKNLLEASKLTFDDVVKTTLFIKNMNDFAEINAIYGNYFKNHKPARSTVEVSRLPKDVLIEIEFIARLK